MILVKTNHPYLRVGHHNCYQSIMGVIHRVRPIFENHGADTVRCPYKDYSSLNRWQANKDLLSVIYFSATTHR
jgi:hypothetical protein